MLSPFSFYNKFVCVNLQFVCCSPNNTNLTWSQNQTNLNDTGPALLSHGMKKKCVCFHFNREWHTALWFVYSIFILLICTVSPFFIVFYKAEPSSLEKSAKNYRICRGLLNKLIKCLKIHRYLDKYIQYLHGG